VSTWVALKVRLGKQVIVHRMVEGDFVSTRDAPSVCRAAQDVVFHMEVVSVVSRIIARSVLRQTWTTVKSTVGATIRWRVAFHLFKAIP